MFVVCMFNLGRIDKRVTRANEGEKNGEEDRDTEGRAQRSPDGLDLKL